MFMTKDARFLLLLKDVTDFLVCETLSHKLSDCQCGPTLTSLAMHCLLFLYCIIIGANCFFLVAYSRWLRYKPKGRQDSKHEPVGCCFLLWDPQSVLPT